MDLMGCGTALVTPFHADGAIDEQALYALTQWQIESGINWLVACGTTAETPALNDEEWLRVIRIVTEAAAGRLHAQCNARGGATGADCGAGSGRHCHSYRQSLLQQAGSGRPVSTLQ